MVIRHTDALNSAPAAELEQSGVVVDEVQLHLTAAGWNQQIDISTTANDVHAQDIDVLRLFLVPPLADFEELTAVITFVVKGTTAGRLNRPPGPLICRRAIYSTDVIIFYCIEIAHHSFHRIGPAADNLTGPFVEVI